jgi:predicted RNA-binding Zn-ribbon protein involved in translation (DUF1610 family)
MHDDDLDILDTPNCERCLTGLEVTELGHNRIVWQCPNCGLIRL